MSGPLFDREAFGRAIRVCMAEQNVTAIGVGESVICRVANGKNRPDVESYLRLMRWLGKATTPKGERDA